jgi:hypothetical protein
MPKVPLVLSLPMPYEASLKSLILGFIVSPFARTIEIDVPRPCNNHYWILGFGKYRQK